VLTTRRSWLALFFATALCWIIGGEWVSIHAGVPENHFIDSLGGLSFAIAGVIAADRRPGNALGPLMFGYVFLSYLGNWGNLRVPGLPVIGLMGGQLTGAVLAHIALAYPSGRLQTRGQRWVVGVIYATGAGVCLTLLATFDPRARGCPCVAEPAPFPSRSGAMTALLVGQRSGIVLVPLFLAAIWLRWMRATPAERRDLTPLWLVLFLLAVVHLLSGFASPDKTGDPFAYLIWELQAILTVGIPAVFVWGLLSTRLARSAVGDLVMDLKQAIGELRELARGIHPAILTEEGLPAAVEALADRSSVPVRLQANFDGRLAEPVEAVAYFVVAEPIANIIKYSRACAARVELSRSNGMLLLEVADDGVGGADVSAGSGLRGLADRVAAVRGMFGVDSPPGGGTLVRAEIPCDG
jgi:hypothetical protein